jgi:cell wall-associated NlpC family hydrolase
MRPPSRAVSSLISVLCAAYCFVTFSEGAAQGITGRKSNAATGPARSAPSQASGEGAELDGPQAIYAGRNGEIFVLDQRNHRVLVFKPGGGELTRLLALPGGMEPTDMIATEGALVVWDGKPIALEPRADTLVRSSTTQPSAGKLTGDTILSMFGRATVSNLGSGGAGRSPRGANGAQTPAVMAPIRKLLATHGAGPVAVLVTPAASRHAIDVVVTSRSTKAVLANLRLQAEDRIGSVDVIEIDKRGRLYILAEVVPNKSGATAHMIVARFGANARYEGMFTLPIGPDTGLARRFVTVSPSGEVHFLSNRGGKPDVSPIVFAPVGQVSPPPAARDKSVASGTTAKQPTPPAPPPQAAAAVVQPRDATTAFGSLTRRRVIATAYAFENILWPVTAASYGPDPELQCVGSTRGRRPTYLQGQLGRMVRGVPYCWGCSGSLVEFATRIQRGVLAGNLCTREEPLRELAGVDCSSFVSAAWGLSTHLTTAQIPAFTAVIDPWAMQPGDVLNKPNSHVMLFLGYASDQKVHVMEAATAACNGRVCRNVYSLGSLLARGFVPHRYPALEDAAPTAIATTAVASAQAAASAAQQTSRRLPSAAQIGTPQNLGGPVMATPATAAVAREPRKGGRANNVTR